MRWISQSQPDRAISEATQATKKEPASATACYFLAAVLDEIGETQKAVAEATRGIQLDDKNGDCHFQLGVSLGKQGEMSRAMNEARRALELQPENSRAYDLAFTLACELHRFEEALAIGRDALSVSPFDSDLHYRIALAAGELGDFSAASDQFAYALLLRPNRSEIAGKLHLAVRFAAQGLNAPSQLEAIASSAPDSAALLNELAWLFATHPDAALRDGRRAVQLSERACALTKRKQPGLLATAAAAYAELTKFPEANATARGALSLARFNGGGKPAGLAENLLRSFQSNQPYREEPRP